MKTNMKTTVLWGLASLMIAGLIFQGVRSTSTAEAEIIAPLSPTDPILITAEQELARGRHIFRFDTFGDEAHWGDSLQLHLAIEGATLGGVGPGVSPNTALAVGLKVDVEALPQAIIDALALGQVNLNDPATTLALLNLDAVLGVKGFFNPGGTLSSIGITCALCHSTVDDSFAPGIGRRLDGWPNRDLNVGAIVALAPNLQPLADRLGVPLATVITVLNSWGPGKYDAELNMDGRAFRPDQTSASTLLPAAFGLKGVNLHTYTGWGSVTYWNAYVAITQMRGKGTFYDPRLNNPIKFPIAVRTRDWNIRNEPDLVTSKLAALHFYQLSLSAPAPPRGSFDPMAAGRGKNVFSTKANCARCHVPPLYAEPGWPMHTAQEIGIDDFQAQRSPDGMYRTTPLNGLWTHMKGGFYHDGRFATLLDVVNHYNALFVLGLTEPEKADLVEFLKSLPLVPAPSAVDFNADGQTDLLWRNAATGQNVVWLMTGTTFSSEAILPTIADVNWKIVGAGDFNSDGQTDILWRNGGTGANVVWLMNGTTFSSQVSLESVTDINWEIVESRDFNGDNQTDILWRNSLNGQNLIWFMNGANFSSGTFLPTLADLDWKIGGAADFNADGQVDILWRNGVTGQNVVWFMNGANFSSGTFLLTVSDLNWKIAGVRDFNGDGQADILWRNTANGQNAVWLMTGTNMNGVVTLPVVADGNWEIVGP